MFWLLYPITYPISILCVTFGSISGMLKQHRRADNFFNIAMKLTPHFSLALWGKGISSRMLGDYAQGLYYCNLAMDRNIHNFKIYYSRGACYAGLHQYTQAIQDYSTALNLTSSLTFSLYIERGYAYLSLRQYHAALADFAQAHKLKPNNPDPYINQSAGFIRLKDYSQAITSCNQALSVKPAYATAYCNRGVAYFCMKNYQQAEIEYRQAIKLSPKFALVYANLAELNIRIKNYSYGVELCDHALKLDPKLVNGYSQRAVAYLFQSKITEAVADLEQAQTLEATDLQATALRFWLSLGSTQPGSDAVLYLKSLSAINPYDPYAQVLQAISEGLNGKWDTCLYQLRVAWATENDDLFYPFWIGLACAFMHQDQEALAALTFAIQQTVPGPLLNPLHWLQAARPDFYQQHILVLLNKFTAEG